MDTPTESAAEQNGGRTLRPPLLRASQTPLAGVCLGLSRHLQVSVPMVRAAMIGLSIAGGIGLVLYAWLWVFVPREDEPRSTAAARGLSGPAVESEDPPRGFRGRELVDALTSSPQVLLGGVLLGGAGLIGLQLLGAAINWWLIGPPVILGVGVLLAWSQVDAIGPAADDPGGDGSGREKTRSRRAILWQFSMGVLLVMLALLLLAGGFLPAADLLLGLMVAAMLLAGVALVTAPWLIRLYRTSNTERARAAAEAERADIAAHLHDSVLQTLAMIQKDRHDPVSVERLARRQERQLRGWLYGRDSAGTGTLKEQLSLVAEELEELHSVPVELIAVGESLRTDHRVLVAAAREGMVNALKHAGPASVYLESTASEDSVFIRDRGAGFDLEGIEEDRLGVRESIIGRMRRAGGTARIRSGETGTEVQLSMPVGVRGAATSPIPAQPPAAPQTHAPAAPQSQPPAAPQSHAPHATTGMQADEPTEPQPLRRVAEPVPRREETYG
ncbi:ATP-binding protein [Nesterenkonia lutea]|uniref:Phage shock protein PspC (Stress-responsive transcriptional regulator)/type II secretory pathway component PulJ n=1 Tax=Nesterenkonia lutea TaxID=272919 RepID=A0ABR9JAU5_9MICC|nr:ATP-binding protein [Nesterenkonia lutea]MBE1523049.1 phage shock protein PspC (stress-responsive transcriptional regulator)/type II secretory pathway component PulJ [Nesterenkonia lutea]